ncbi:MAG: dihydrolipoyl dehydrogenase [Planctomycetes bacterium]|nr:dihydrolipoyl dehydrogenase [Planctomycetota bacterium]
MNQKEYDLVIIGGGPGGYVAAIRAAQLGLSVACVDEHAQLGGTCLRVGCIPSKALLESSERFAEARDSLAPHGVTVGQLELDVAQMQRRKEQIVKTLVGGIDGLFKQAGVTKHQGRGRLDGPGRVIVAGEDREQTLQARNILIASGSRPAPLKGVELDGNRIGTSTEALAYGDVPEHLVVIGAGYIGLELGSVWKRLGSKVTVLEALDRILPGMDLEIAKAAQQILKKQGIEFRLQTRVKSASVEQERCVVRCEDAEAIDCDRVLLAVGRVPNTDNLGLESVGIEVDGRGEIPVGDDFATTAPGVYAIGDCIRGPKLAHKASHEGLACVEGIAGGHGHVDYDAIPGVVYTHPEIASVGKSEERLKEMGREYRKGLFPLQASGRARTLGETDGKVKILADAETDRILGVHILADRAGELIAEAAAALTFGASAEDLARVCHAHPTLAESLGEAAMAVNQRAIHIPRPRSRT